MIYVGETMQNQDSPITQRLSRDTATQTRLTGSRLWVARAVWVIGFVALTAMYALGFTAYRQMISTVCQNEPCNFRQVIRHTETGDEVVGWPGPPIGYALPLRPEQVEALESLGLTLEQYGWFGALQLAIPILVALLIAAVLFWRKSDSPMVLFASALIASLHINQIPLPFALVLQQPVWQWVDIPVSIFSLVGFLMFPLMECPRSPR